MVLSRLFNLTFHQMAILLMCHFIKFSISSISIHFIKLPLHNFGSFETHHFMRMTLNLFILSTFQFGQLAILSTCHFINLPFYQLAILSTCHFINLPFYQLAIISTCHFTHSSFNQLTISIIQCFINLQFDHTAICLTYHFVSLQFRQLTILPTCHF